MLRLLLLTMFVAALASQIPALLGLTNVEQPVVADTDARPAGKAGGTPPSSPTDGGATIVLPADPRGHFVSTFRFNGKPVEGMIDTGATAVAINESLARRLGYTANSLDYRFTSRTANGEAKYALILLDRVEIDGIRVSKVEAAVLKDTSLSGTLVGMSFLKRLSSFRVEGDKLYLTR